MAVLGAAFFMPASATAHEDTPDTRAIRGILTSHHSPLPWWTIDAFKKAHPDFDIAGYLTVVQCESGMGTTGGSARYCNPGNIKYRAGTKEIWHTLASGKWYCKGQGWYNVYPDMYTGQRAVIRLLYDSPHGYNALLAAHDWEGFSRMYFGGPAIAGYYTYLGNLRKVHDRLVAEAAMWGATW